MNKPSLRADSELFRKRARAAAVRVFARHGFEGTSVQAIADEVGVSKQALLYHFPSKEDLRQAALEEMVSIWRNVLPRLLSALTRQGAGFEEALAEMVEFSRAEPAYARFLMQELLRGKGPRHPILQDVDPWLQAAAQIIRAAQKDGKVDPAVDPEAWVVNIGTFILGTLCLLDTPVPGTQPRSDRVVREMARVIGASLVLPLR
jgi:TetR/AcrR family transcriptional regulator